MKVKQHVAAQQTEHLLVYNNTVCVDVILVLYHLSEVQLFKKQLLMDSSLILDLSFSYIYFNTD